MVCQRDLMVIVPRPRYACIPTEMSIRSDRNAPTCQHQRPIIHYKKKAQFFKAVPFFVRTELSQVYYGLAKVQFLKKIVLHLKSIALFLKSIALFLKIIVLYLKNGVLHINKKVGGRFAFTRLKLLLTLPK